MFDEVDAIFGRHGKDDGAEDLRGLLNAGHRRGASIPRCVGKTQEVVKFPVFAAVALAGLGDLPDTLMSRSVIIRMRRRAPHERVASFRFRDVEPAGHLLRDRLAAWAKRNITELTDARPAMPPGVEDRPADCWEPLLAVADAVGGDWPVRARAACIELVKVGASREASLGVRLLTDLRTVFGKNEVMATEDILTELYKMDESPWGDLRGRPLDPRGLARRLKEYGVNSVGVRVGDRTPKGYRRGDLWDAWQRYLPAEAQQAPQGQPPRSEAPPPVADSHPVADTSATPPTNRNALTSEVASVADVAHLRGATPCGHPAYRSAKCPLCIAHKNNLAVREALQRDLELLGRTTCHVCLEPIDPAVGEDTHPGCEEIA